MRLFFLYNIKNMEIPSTSNLFLEFPPLHTALSYTKTDNRFKVLKTPKRLWAISAIHAQIDQLVNLHDEIFPQIRPGDKIIYTGNYTGYGTEAIETLNEMLSFRRSLLAQPAMMPDDFIYLRGAQEEMWQKLQQLQFAPYPLDALLWMLGNGLKTTLNNYGISEHDGVTACKQGMVGISDWTRSIKESIKRNPGHSKLSKQFVRASFTLPETNPSPMLFVHAGIDNDKPLDTQQDSFWWGSKKFDQLSGAYAPFTKIVRGYDPAHNGPNFNCIKATIDGGCGFGGKLTCAVFDNHASLLDANYY